jgi:Cdc6-like AAA superfamily ATPase
MKDFTAWFGLKRFPFDKNIKTQDALDTEPLKECSARLDYIKRRGGILLLTGDPGVGKTLALRQYVDGPSMKTSLKPSTPPFPPSAASICSATSTACSVSHPDFPKAPSTARSKKP